MVMGGFTRLVQVTKRLLLYVPVGTCVPSKLVQSEARIMKRETRAG